MAQVPQVFEIPLTQGLVALVDAEDFDRVSQHKWCAMRTRNTTYAVRMGNDGLLLMHRFIFGLHKGDKNKIDHINEIGIDNRRSNLRLASNSQNGANTSRVTGQTSKYKGVSRGWRKGKWRAEIKINYIGIHLGTFDSETEAAEAYDKAAKGAFGEYANTNF